MGVLLEQVVGLIARLLPAGGSTGNVLKKLSADDYEVGWGDPGTAAVRYEMTSSITESIGTMTALPGLAFVAAANKKYLVKAYLIYSANNTSVNAGITANITGPAGATLYSNWRSADGATHLVIAFSTVTSNSRGHGSTANAPMVYECTATMGIGATGGTIQFQARRSANVLTVHVGSYIEVTEI